MKKSKPNIGIVTVPIGDNGIIPLSNLLEILSSLSDDIHVVTGSSGYTFAKKSSKVYAYNIGDQTKGINKYIDIINSFIINLRIAYKIFAISKNVDFWIFFFGGESLLPAMLVTKLYRKPVLLALAGSAIDGLKIGKNPLAKVRTDIIYMNRILSNGIIIYSKSFIKNWDLVKHTTKIYIANEHLLDFSKFKVKTKYEKRKNVVGYIGTLTEGKGVFNFLLAIPEIIKKRDDLEFLIGGNGPLRNKIKKHIKKHNLTSKVKLVEWIPHNEIPDHLNDLKLCILPSLTEGLPNIMLEAMACGTPFLTTRVGAIPDFIRNEETGFLIEDISPKCIAKSVLNALEFSDIEKIINNASLLVKRDLSHNKKVEMYRIILNDFTKN